MLDKLFFFYIKTHKTLWRKLSLFAGEHQYELLDFVAAKFYDEQGIFKLLVSFLNHFTKNIYINKKPKKH